MSDATHPQFEDDTVYVVPEVEAASGGGDHRAMPAPPPRRKSALRSVRRHKRVALLMVGLVAAVAVPVIGYLSVKPLYFAESLLLVPPLVPKNMIEDRDYQLPRYEEFVNQQVAMLAREDVTLDALDRLKERRTLWILPGESRREAAFRLSRSLIARRLPNTTYISVGLEGPKPDGLADIVNAVVDSYLGRLKGQPLMNQDQRLDALNRHKAELQQEIRSKTELLTSWAKELGVPGFDAKPNEQNGGAPSVERLAADARAKRLEAEAKHAALVARQEMHRKMDLESEAREQLGSDPEFSGIRTVLLAKKNELRAKLTGLTLEHEGRLSTERMIAEVDAELQTAEKAALGRVQQVLAQRREQRFKDDRILAEMDLEQARKYEDMLAIEARDQAAKTNRYNSLYYEVQAVHQEVDRLHKQLGAVTDRIDLMRLESQGPGLIQRVALAMPPEGPVKRPLLPILGLFGALAAVLALGVPAVLDATDQRVHSPLDVEAVIEARTLGWILDRRPQTEEFVRDQVRRLALSLDRERRLFNRTQFVFTSLRPGGGNTQLVLDIGRELRAIGARVVVVEANALHPDPRLAPPEGRPGLAMVLSGAARIDDALMPAQDGLPEYIPIGDTGGKPHLAGCRNVRPLLDRLAGRFEMVLLDAPPILYSSDAELLAGGAHAAILVVEAEKVVTGEVKRALQILRQVGPPVVQAVVNRVRDQGGLGYYADLLKQYEAAGRPRPS